MTIEQLAIIVKVSDGTFRQVALTQKSQQVITHLLPSFFDDKVVKILPNELSLTLDPYKSTQNLTFTCFGCGHNLPSNFCMRTPNYCYLCDPKISVDELLSDEDLAEPQSNLVCKNDQIDRDYGF